MGHSNILKWITLPPIVSILISSMVRSLGNPEAAVLVDPSIWAMTILLFVILSVLYGLFIIHDFSSGLIALQALSQGVLLCPLALAQGARMIQWIGVLFAVCGAAALASIYHQHQEQREHGSHQGAEAMESRLPVPFAVTDDTGAILTISEPLMKVLGLHREDVPAVNITQIMTPGEPAAEFGGKTWDVIQEQMGDDRYYFQFTEAKPEPAPVEPAAPADPIGLVDPATRLYSFPYAMNRVDEELYRMKRYGHPLSAILLRLAFPDNAEQDHSAQAAFNAYCAVVRRGLRASDTATLAAERSVLVVLPECPKGPAESVLQRLIVAVNALCPTYPVFYDVTTLQVSASFVDTDKVPTAQGMLDQLESAMNQKYSLNAGGAA